MCREECRVEKRRCVHKTSVLTLLCPGGAIFIPLVWHLWRVRRAVREFGYMRKCSYFLRCWKVVKSLECSLLLSTGKIELDQSNGKGCRRRRKIKQKQSRIWYWWTPNMTIEVAVCLMEIKHHLPVWGQWNLGGRFC